MDSPKITDLEQGISASTIADGEMIQGKVRGQHVILAREGGEFFAVGATCPHYGGPLIQGLLRKGQLRCPLHHACFSLQSGEALRAPAFDRLPCWRVERAGEKIYVRDKLPAPPQKHKTTASSSTQLPKSVVIVGGGAAGFAAAEMLRREGYEGSLTMLSADDSLPYDRPNLSKDYLAGSAEEEWMPLRPPEFYPAQKIAVELNTKVTDLDLRNKRVLVANGTQYDFDALLLATGGDPVRLPIPGAAESQIHYLRTFADGRELAKKAASAKQVVVVGASFIALECTASLRERGVAVHVVAEHQPLERVFGPEVGAFVRELHESHGVAFHLGQTLERMEGTHAVLSGGERVEADFVILGVGVRPVTGLAEQAGLKIDRGIVVNEYLETSEPGVFAAGDIARWPDPHSGQSLRIEHWVVAERQGQTAARNILGYRERFDAVPFFWTQQYGVSIRYVGHAEKWDAVDIDGRLQSKDCTIRYKLGDRILAVATVSRDLESLRAEVTLEAVHA